MSNDYPWSECCREHTLEEQLKRSIPFTPLSCFQPPVAPSPRKEVEVENLCKDEPAENPDRYKTETTELRHVIRDVFGKADYERWCVITAFKYLARYQKKGGVRDIEKARDYLDFFVESAGEKEAEQARAWEGA